MKVDDKTIYITELISAVAVTLAGLFLTLAGLNVFPFSIGRCWLITVYVCFFVISCSVAILQKNSIGICFCWIFGLLIVTQIFILSGYLHRNIYPLYILAVSIGIVNASVFKGYSSKLFKVALAISLGACVLFLESTGTLPLKAVLPILAIYFGMIGIVYAAVKLYKNSRNKENK